MKFQWTWLLVCFAVALATESILENGTFKGDISESEMFDLSEQLIEATIEQSPDLEHIVRLVKEIPEVAIALSDRVSYNLMHAINKIIDSKMDLQAYSINIHAIIISLAHKTNSTIQYHSSSLFLHQQIVTKYRLKNVCGDFNGHSSIDCDDIVAKQFQVQVEDTTNIELFDQTNDNTFKMSIFVTERKSFSKFYSFHQYQPHSHVVHVGFDHKKSPNSLPEHIKSTKTPVKINFKVPRENASSNMFCAELSSCESIKDCQKWQKDACRMTYLPSSGIITCHCKNAGTFSVLSEKGVEMESGYVGSIFIVLAIILSMTSLFVTFIVIRYRNAKKEESGIISVSELSHTNDKQSLMIPT